MDSHQRRCGLSVSHGQGDGFFYARVADLAELAAEAMNAELAPACGEIRGCDLTYRFFSHTLDYSGRAVGGVGR